MIRFTADEEEIAALLKFLRRRAPNRQIDLVPLAMPPLLSLPGTVLPPDRRARRTARPVLRRLAADTRGACWGLQTTLDARQTGVPLEDTCLILLLLGEADTTGQREALLEARDEFGGEPVEFTPRALLARSLVERAMRRIRRRATFSEGRWHTLPTH